ncbi:hypothetical protein [Phocaeicola massiliensis]|uniref:hypothetical protein n=1 Tax=Phocaeicola massiliensis TaxID=204516 RepID=UPI000E40FA4C|nr:hypothetical protein [Phocaeicola massiliensis]RGE98912.1 hypothetical protein DW267_11160 [Bacteroides sp. AM22-3LB]
MNKKFLSAILFGALMVSSTGTFVSCKDYDDDIDAINKELTDLKSKLSDLESKVNAGGAYVTKIESVDGGFKVSVSDGTSYNLTVASAAPGSKVVIDDKTGEISIDGKATGWFATTGEGEEAVDMTPYVKDGYWYFYDKAAKDFVKSEYKAAGDAYAVVKDGVVTLHMPDESGKMQSIVLPLTANALTAISLPAGLTIGNTVATDAADDAEAISSAKAAKLDWKGPKGAIEKDQFLVGQIGVADLVVSPKNYDLSAQKLTLVDSKGNVAPVKVIATPNTFNSVIVGDRAASENGNWNLTVEMTDEVTADNINKVFKGTGANADKEILYALCVNGIPYTAYDIAIKTKAPETSVAAITFAAAKLSYIDAEGTEVKGATDAIELPVGTTTLKYADANLYDSYITFEGTYKAKAEKLGVKADGMTVTVPQAASGETLDATVHMVNIGGVETTTSNTITLKLAGASIDTPTEISATEYKVMPNADFTKVLPAILIDLGDALSKLDAATIEAVQKADQLSVVEAATQEGFIVASTANVFTSTYYKANAQGKKGAEWSASNDGLESLRFIEIAVATSESDNKVAEDAKPGKYTLNLVIKDGTTVGNEIAKIAMPVNVTVPAFDDLFAATDAWTEGVYGARIYPSTNDALISMSNAYTAKSGVDANYNKIAYAFDKINNVAVGTVGNAQQVTLNKDVVYKDKALANSELKATASYSILDAMTAYTGSGSDATKLTAIKKAFTVESSKFTVKLQTIFDGGKIVFYKDNAVVTGTVGIAADGKIAGLTISGSKKQGLAINFLSEDLAVNSTNVANSYPSADANKLQGYAFGNSNASDASDKQIKVTWSTGIPTVTVAEGTGGLEFTNSDSSSPTYETTLTATFEDATGIVYTSSIKVEKK